VRGDRTAAERFGTKEWWRCGPGASARSRGKIEKKKSFQKNGGGGGGWGGWGGGGGGVGGGWGGWGGGRLSLHMRTEKVSAKGFLITSDERKKRESELQLGIKNACSRLISNLRPLHGGKEI